ncbi:hypothetical protein GOBAR_DD01340 [Gossypium barbadense]|nr:hypothetical protein GOBAR_DD01340 [Gossypium barbadense]
MDAPSKIGDRSTSDVVVRLRTLEGRDEWIYCHSDILVEKSKYFADRLSDNWPTCQILDSRNCVEVYCQELDFDHHVNVLRLFYVVIDGSVDDLWNGVKNALGILQVGIQLGCPQIVTACVNYLEAVPWEESEEEEILRIIPGMGSEVEPILARLQPVNLSAIRGIFISTLRFALSSPPSLMNDLKSSAQEQLEYMVTEDDDSPLLIADDDIKSEKCIYVSPQESVDEAGKMTLFQSYLADFSWACQLLSKLEIMRVFVNSWVDASDKIVAIMQSSPTVEMIGIKLKVVEVVAKVLESIGYGTVILPTTKRLRMVKIWLPFVRITKPLIDSVMTSDYDSLEFKIDGELWQSLESTFVSILLALPSVNQAEILTEWLENEYIRYPDLTEAFEVWCYRSKVANRRLALIEGGHCAL